MAKERNIDDALYSLNELVEMQQKTLTTANEIMSLKDQRLRIADDLINAYKRENKTLKISFFILIVISFLQTILTAFL